MLLKITKLNQYFIKLQKGKLSSYKPFYNLGLIEFKILKTYIITNLANSFICYFKALVDVFIFFIQKLNGSFQLYIDY